MYNNKQHRIAQKSFQEGWSNVKDYLSDVGQKAPKILEGLGHLVKEKADDIPELIERIKSGDESASIDIKEMAEQGKDIIALFAPYLGGDLYAKQFFRAFGLEAAAGLPLVPSLLYGGAALLGSEALMSVAENIKGDLAIYKDYLSDFHKDLDALSKLYPDNSDLQELIKVMRKYGDDGLQIIEKAKAKKKASRNKNYKIAIVGEANWGSYAHQGLSGAAMGAAMGGGPIGAAIGALGMGLADASKDWWHSMQTDEYKAAAYTHELKEKTTTLVNQLNKYDKLFGIQLSKVVDEFDNYVRKYIYQEEDVKDPKNLLGYLEILKKSKNRNNV
jgi:hypothetical protein